jgi:protein TonB
VALAADVVAESGPDPAGLRQFRLALAGEARRFRRYPDAARRAGLAGTAEVRVAVEAGGLNRSANIARSSGHALLDTAALEMLQQAASQVALPESLRGQRFTVLLPVVFEVAE